MGSAIRTSVAPAEFSIAPATILWPADDAAAIDDVGLRCPTVSSLGTVSLLRAGDRHGCWRWCKLPELARTKNCSGTSGIK